MARVGIKKEDIFLAADSISARGINPTISAIREELGNTGSMTTISTYLTQWREKNKEISINEEIPENVQNACFEVMKKIWVIAEEEANREIKAIKQSCDDKVKELELENARLEKLCLEMDKKCEKLDEIEKLNGNLCLDNKMLLGQIEGLEKALTQQQNDDKKQARRKPTTA